MKTKMSNLKTQTRKNTLQLAYWTASWLVTTAIATFGPIFLWSDYKLLTFFAIIINLGAGVGVILANIRHLRGLDELQQKIHLNAMGIALGVGVIGGLSYSLLDTTNLIAGDAEISVLVMGISMAYLIAIVAGNRYYR